MKENARWFCNENKEYHLNYNEVLSRLKKISDENYPIETIEKQDVKQISDDGWECESLLNDSWFKDVIPFKSSIEKLYQTLGRICNGYIVHRDLHKDTLVPTISLDTYEYTLLWYYDTYVEGLIDLKTNIVYTDEEQIRALRKTQKEPLKRATLNI
jgi:hypothetical protein